MREIDSNVWLNATMKETNKYKNVIIDDIRYYNELECLKKYNWILHRPTFKMR